MSTQLGFDSIGMYEPVVSDEDRGIILASDFRDALMLALDATLELIDAVHADSPSYSLRDGRTACHANRYAAPNEMWPEHDAMRWRTFIVEHPQIRQYLDRGRIIGDWRRKRLYDRAEMMLRAVHFRAHRQRDWAIAVFGEQQP